MSANLDKLSEEIYKFEKKAEFDKTSKKQIVKWLEKEVKNYKKAKTRLIKRNKLMDIIILTMQIARRENMSLNKALERWWKKSKKYLERK